MNRYHLLCLSGFLIGALLGLVSCTGENRDAIPTGAAEPSVGMDIVSGEIPTSTPHTTSETEPHRSADPFPTRFPPERYADLEIVTLLPRDAIPAIDNPRFLSAAEADEYYDPDELVMGVVYNGDARAYSVPFLSNREIVNDTVGGVKIAVTW
jgi:hypothetical protein